ncbi:GNAT family N-acetyltransferase [Nocardioides flavus (ex Wang et al. 2016)]|uniref:GNAT family N-acetyltransferase n=1 Tax=Nocardioides flavus (ex Wang et al. 2016) TaxID=2058780 RepID=A0ABQ3HT22_9ACTN|nr:GNAT family N-acetyltransferase [Nocardioides flavus (ex Wang et al. 2016)]GHE19354.1 GNAT family N-acetyltransferase [Nocardioides flavus (ex Wang et al. 2016)]
MDIDELDIDELDPADATARAAWHDVMERSVRAGRPHALATTLAAFEVVTTAPSTYYSRTWLRALVDDEVVGVAELELPLTENTDVAQAEVHVLPEHRRRGVGRALWEELVQRSRAAGRTRVGSEVTVAAATGDDDRGGAYDFARAMGALERHREDHLLADLPVPAAAADPAYELLLWRGRCPDEHRGAYLDMRNQMNADVPSGELDREPPLLDDARLAASEHRLMQAYDVRVAAARRCADGVLGGYSLLFVPHGTDYGWQDDTLVMPDHRGHRLGAALKAANYADLPAEVACVHTWTAPDNTAMHRTNTALGFRVVERMYEMEAVIA